MKDLTRWEKVLKGSPVAKLLVNLDTLRRQNKALREALVHIAWVAKNSRTGSTRSQWIAERAKSALNNNERWKKAKTPPGYRDASGMKNPYD